MPLYEFYCEPCHTVFTFRSARVDTVTVPLCPRCGKSLKREVSPFAHIMSGAVKAADAQDLGCADRMEQAAAQLGERLQALDDDDSDPREAVRVMRELSEAGGLRYYKEVQEAMARIEAGEDPEKIDEDFREVFDTDNPFADAEDDAEKRGVSWLRRLRGPTRDPKWHDLSPQDADAELT